MNPPMQFTTIFAQKLESRTGTSALWLAVGITISLIVVVIGIVLAAPFLLVVIPLAIIVNYRIAQHQKPKYDGFFIDTNWYNDIYYGYIDHKGTQHSHQLIDEYTYWYYPESTTMNGTKCILVVMLKSNKEEVFLKEEVLLIHEPEGWGYEGQNVTEGPRVWHMRNLFELVNIMNRVGITEPDAKNV